MAIGKLDGALGAIVGSACGDALGAPYEFKPPLDKSIEVVMEGGSGWQPGEWTDDTAMAVPILQAVAVGKNLLDAKTQDEIVAAWYEWSRDANDVGIQTRQVLNSLREPFLAIDCKDAAMKVHNQTGRSGGNGSLMRTAPVALAFIGDADGLWRAANEISALTHFDPETGEACGLWCLAIRETILSGEMASPEIGFEYLHPDRRQHWQQILEEAESNEAVTFENNGWVRHAFQAAWSICSKARTNQNVFYAELISEAVRVGNDTDTVAAIAGGLLGAHFGLEGIPDDWVQLLNGYPNYTAKDLISLVEAVDLGE